MSQQRPDIFAPDDSVIAAWNDQVAAAAKTPLLSRLLAQCGSELFPRFVASYAELRVLPRRTRRALQRRLARSCEMTWLVKDRMQAHAGRALQHKLAWSLAGAALLLALGQQVQAADITVTTNKPNINADGKCSLIEATVNANNNAQTHADCVAGSGADTIILPKSSHVLTQANNGINGLPLITSPITIEGNGAKISAKKGPAPFRLIQVNAGGNLTLNNVILSGGSSSGGGGAIFNNGGTLSINNSTITGNRATYGGGALLNYGNATIQNTTITKNSARYGGGFYNNNAGVVTITDSTVSGNKAINNVDEAYGGGIANYGTLTVQNSIITKNTASSPAHGGYGGGIVNVGTAVITNSTISANKATSNQDDASGGGISNYGTLTIMNSIITKNSAKTTDPNDNSYGGGINNYGGTITVTNSTVSGNQAEFGAGIYNDFGTVTVENSTISGNKASVLGGGLFNDATMTVVNGTITKNSARFGGGIYNDGGANLTLNRTLISGNKGPSGGPEVYNDIGATANANNFNLFGSNNNAGVAGFVPGLNDIVPIAKVTAAKILSSALKDNGGPTPTHALVAGSPALDASSCIKATDQRGVNRPQGAACDIGAFELEGP